MSKHWELVGGEVLVTRANTAERVAAVAQVPLDIRGGLFLCDKTLRLDFDESGAHPAFVAEMLLAPQAREQVSSMATGVGSSMVNISQSKLRSWILPMPSLETQVSVARQMRTIRELTRSLDNESTALNRLKSQLLSRLLDGSIILDQAYDDVLEVA